MYNAYVTKISNLRKHPNADRLLLGECFGNTVCVSNDYTDGQIGVYFPTDGQLSVEFAEYNNLVRKKDENGNNIGGYMDAEKRNVTAIKLRGEKSDGLFLPLSCLEKFGDITNLKVGDIVSVFNGTEIACKYIPRTNMRSVNVTTGNRVRKKKAPISPLFVEHADTEQLAYNMSAFKCGDLIEVTLKMHGSSQRTGYLPVFKGYKRTILDKILKHDGTSIYDWGYISGTRRTVLENYDGGYYGSNSFREKHSKFFEGKLYKGEEVYYEVVGFTDSGKSIMGQADNKKLNDKDFVRQYGDITTFSYGCSVDGAESPQNDFYVYRMTMTNEDGAIVEYTPDFMRYRCEQMGCKYVPVLWKGYIPENPCDNNYNPEYNYAGEFVKNIAEQYYDGADPIGKTHVREGVVIRIINRPKFCAYKHKNFAFKVLSGIAIADMENSGNLEGISDDMIQEM